MRREKILQLILLLILITSVFVINTNSLLYLDKNKLLWMVILIPLSIIIISNNRIINNGPWINITTIVLSIIVSTSLIKNISNIYHIKSWYYLGYIILFHLIAHIKLDKKFYTFFLLCIGTISMYEIIISILQILNFIELKSQYFSFSGSFKSPNHLGGILAIGTITNFRLLIISKQTYTKILTSILLLTSVTLLIMTKSRGAIISLLVSSIVIIAYYIPLRIKDFIKKRILIITPITLIISLVLGLFLYNLNKDSIKGRALIAKITMRETIKEPIYGHGINTFPKKYNDAKTLYFSKPRDWDEIKVANPVSAAFNDWLEMSFELGYIFTFLLLAIILYIIIKTPNNKKTIITKGIIIFLCLFSLTNTIKIFPIFIIIGIIAIQCLIQIEPLNIKKKHHWDSLLLSICKGSQLTFTIVLLVLMSQRIYAEHYIKKNNLLEKHPNTDTLLKKSTFININGSHLLRIALRLKNKELSIRLIQQACRKSYLNYTDIALATLYKKESNYAKADSIYKSLSFCTPYIFRYKYERLKNFNRLSQKRKSVKVAKEIINLPVKIPSKKVDQFKSLAQQTLKRYENKIYDTIISGELSSKLYYQSEMLNMSIPYRIYTPNIKHIYKKLPVIYINDGSNYIKRGQLHKKIDSLIENKVIEPLIAIFIDPKDINQKQIKVRPRLFIKNKKFVQFYRHELIPQLEKRYPISNLKKDRTIWGVSFGGLFAAYIADKEPTLFKNVIMQSPAFHPDKQVYKNYANKPKRDFKMYLSYGTGKDTENQDLPMIKALQKQHYDLKIKKVEGGNHSWDVWEKQLNEILIHFFGKNKAS